MKTFIIWLNALLIVSLLIFTDSCKHDKNIKPTTVTGPDTIGKVFTNVSDPRIAEITRDSNRVTFFGVKNAVGDPISLSGYRIQALNDTSKNDYVNFDDQGRYSTILLRTGQLIKFGYTSKDSVVVSIVSTKDTVSVYKVARAVRGSSINHQRAKTLWAAQRARVASASQKTSIDIQVVAKNTLGQERNIDDAQVIVNMNGSASQNYTEMATHVGNGLYTVPIPGSFLTTDTQIIQNVITFLQNALNVACFDCDSGCQNTLVETLEPLCVFAGGASVICATVIPVVIFACKFQGSELADYFGDLLKEKLDNFSEPDNARVTAYANDFSLGDAYAAPVTISQIQHNTTGGYDMKITYVDNSIIGTWGLSYTWSGDPTYTEGITFNSDNTFDDTQGNAGVYVQNINQVTFTYNNTTQYRGSGDYNSYMSGTMLAYNGVPGVWSMSR